MSVTVRTSPARNISVSQGAQATGSITVKKGGDLTIQSLSNVDSTDLQDGYTLVYDSILNKWVASPVNSGAIQSVDGGTY